MIYKDTTQEIPIVFLVAGISSRFGGKIKQFAKIGPNGETLIEYSLNQALKAGFNRIIFVVGAKTEKPFKELFGNEYNGIKVEYAFEGYDPAKRDRPWGTIDAVCSASNLINSSFVICNGDDIYGEESFKLLINHLKKSQEEAVIGYPLLETFPEKGLVNRGIMKTDNKGYVLSIEETFNIDKNNLSLTGSSLDDMANMNLFGLHKKILPLLKEKLDKFKEENKEDRKKECILTIEFAKLIKEKKIKMKVYKTNSKWFGVTNPEDEAIVREQLKNLL